MNSIMDKQFFSELKNSGENTITSSDNLNEVISRNVSMIKNLDIEESSNFFLALSTILCK